VVKTTRNSNSSSSSEKDHRLVESMRDVVLLSSSSTAAARPGDTNTILDLKDEIFRDKVCSYLDRESNDLRAPDESNSAPSLSARSTLLS
jgi:hypothetical protein